MNQMNTILTRKRISPDQTKYDMTVCQLTGCLGRRCRHNEHHTKDVSVYSLTKAALPFFRMAVHFMHGSHNRTTIALEDRINGNNAWAIPLLSVFLCCDLLWLASIMNHDLLKKILLRRQFWSYGFCKL